MSESSVGDVVVVDPIADRAAMAALPHGHAFSGARALKRARGPAVFVVIDGDDAVGVQLTRFVLADGALRWHAAEGRLDVDELHAPGRSSARPSVEDLLSRLQRDAGEGGQESSLQRLLRFEREDSLLTRLQDAETGLFDGPYATVKLDEEWKRAHRFHQPLSLLLLDLGIAPSLGDAARRAALAEASGVLLNECRDIDVLARFSPDVFLLLLPGTGAEGARVLAERIVASLQARLRGIAAATPVGGLCTVPSAEVRDRKSFVAVAEACLERARRAGTGGVSASWQ
ncbi:MAG: diguanylate cyclase [Planctomycetes bacterium]|nr:diguanylate cyclase [Planctomycetota bacterium]